MYLVYCTVFPWIVCTYVCCKYNLLYSCLKPDVQSCRSPQCNEHNYVLSEFSNIDSKLSFKKKYVQRFTAKKMTRKMCVKHPVNIINFIFIQRWDKTLCLLVKLDIESILFHALNMSYIITVRYINIIKNITKYRMHEAYINVFFSEENDFCIWSVCSLI